MAKKAAQRKPPAKKPPGPKKRSLRTRLLLFGLKLGFLGVLVGASAVVGGYLYFSRDLPNFRSLADWRPAQTTRIFAADGTLVAEIGVERRTVVPRERIADAVVKAVLSAEDAAFYEHEGLDYSGMARALYNSVRAGRLTGSGSTITQQTVKNLVLSPARTFERKAREIILARRLETRLSKDDILTLYLNAIYLGHGRYGVQEAAQFYWGKDAAALTVPEAATLAGLISSPERYSPRKHPERAKTRRAFVLKEMAENGYITTAQRDAAAKAPLGLAPRPKRFREAAWFAEAVRAQLVEALGEEAVTRGGLQVTTTLDPRRQAAAVEAVRAGLRELDDRQKFGKRAGHARDPAPWRRSRAKALGGAPPTPGKAVEARVEAVEAKHLVLDLGVGRATLPRSALARFAKKDAESPYGVGDLVRVAVRADGPRHPDTMRATLAGVPQGAMVVLDPGSGDVLALVGGYDDGGAGFDRAIQAKRQTGSAFKPFVWGAAYESRQFTTATVMVDAPETWPLSRGKFWKPKNYTGKYRGPVSLTEALAHSVNSISVRLANDVGVGSVHAFARAAGMKGALTDNLTVALGSSEMSPLELASAYATLAAGGRRASPRMVVSVRGPDGPVASPLTAEPEVEEAIDPALAFIVRDTMRAVVEEGSARRLRNFPRPVAAKTGTSNEARDTWFVALLPDVVAVAWVGFDTPRPLGRKEAGSRTALPVVQRYLEAVEKDGPGWPPPPAGVVVRLVDRATGKLARPGDEGSRELRFLEGTEPSEYALREDELDAATFVMREAAALGGPDLAVPRVEVAPLPEDLRPLGGIAVEAAPEEPEEPEEEDPGDDEDRPE